ncbi:3-isopropylmalate dehydratase large subunit [Caulobacter sp. AP07]|uniref:3-isopropylmalate dehydratase large subunit n=1 Tax=Caulobacter sp. AP07 TaxID=1144304 RepID=UPI001EE6528D|nr:3-isopropylmalate dehydratase large subunit [Caulobacter sp. AP07]
MSLFDKLWRQNLIEDLGEGRGLIHIDRHLLHELSSPQAFAGLRQAERVVRSPDLAFAVPDHIVDTGPGRGDRTVPGGEAMIRALRANAKAADIALFDVGDPRHGIVHVVAAEQGIALPGMAIACGDSHTCTLGALGAWAFGIGTSDVEHILATQTLVMRKPASSRLTVTGTRAPGVSAKDLALGIIAQIGVNAAKGGVLEIAGPAIEALTMEERFTLCNMGIEASARSAIIAPDATTFAYVAARPNPPVPLAPAIAAWRALRSDPDARFDAEFAFDCDDLAPQVSWGTNPGQTIGVNQAVPDAPSDAAPRERDAALRALAYMGLEAGQPILGLPVSVVFIGSCTNSRLSDLQVAARVVEGRKVAPGVRALVVPGSARVKAEAEALGLDAIFVAAGFEWREAGCSMCVGMNSDRVAPGERSVSTSNRNFEGRQGPGARTHLASPATAAASAIAGAIADPRAYLR